MAANHLGFFRHGLTIVLLAAPSVPAVVAAQPPLRALQRSGAGRASTNVIDSARVSTSPSLMKVRGDGTTAVSDPWWIPVTSAIVPGAGQLLLRQDRALAYMVVEAFIVGRYVRNRQEADRQRASYRELARTAARSLFATGPLPDGDFDYYELMEKYVESGVYDLVPGGDVDPEDDATTFNGSVWRLARETFWTDANQPPAPTSSAYLRALDFYMRRAIRPDFRWSWRNARLEQDVYVRTIDASNQAFRNSIADLGALLANHALSTVDAYVTLRLRWRPNAREEARLEAGIPWPVVGRP